MSVADNVGAISPPTKSEVYDLDDQDGYFKDEEDDGNNSRGESRPRGARMHSSVSVGSIDSMGDLDGDDDEGAGLDRIRALMLNFYGSGGGDSLDDGGEDKIDRSMDIDHASFDPPAYVRRAVREDTLTQLLQADETLVSEVQELNNDMQNLVYENYNKFIDATDTIRKMKHQVEGMESEIELLMKTMENVDTRAKDINSQLRPRRAKIENMVSLQRLIKRLEFLFELPLRLKRSIELEAFSQAVKYYNMASGILEKYSDVASFGAIQVESKEIMSSLKSRIVASLEYHADSRPSTISENIRLLIDLGDPHEGLSERFLSWYKKRLDFRLGEIRNCLNSRNGSLGHRAELSHEANADKKSSLEIMWTRNSAFLSDMNTFLEDHRELFGDAITVSANDGEQKKLKSFVRGIFADYFDAMRTHLVGFGGRVLSSDKPDEQVKFILSHLQKFQNDLLGTSRILKNHSLQMRLDDRSIEITENAIRTHIVNTFQALKEELMICLVSASHKINARHVLPAEHKTAYTFGNDSSSEATRDNAVDNDVERPPKKPVPLAPSAQVPTSASTVGAVGNPFQLRNDGNDVAVKSKNPFQQANTESNSPGNPGNPFEETVSSAGAHGSGNPFGDTPEAKLPTGIGNPFSSETTSVSGKKKPPDAGNPFSGSSRDDSHAKHDDDSGAGDNDDDSVSGGNGADDDNDAGAVDMKGLSGQSVSEVPLDSHGSGQSLAAKVRDTVQSLVSQIESTLNVLRPLLDATSSGGQCTLLPGMDSIFLDLVRGECVSSLSWLACQCESQCDRVGMDTPGLAITSGSGNFLDGKNRSGDNLNEIMVAFQEDSSFVFAASCIFRDLSTGKLSGPCDALGELYDSISGGNLDSPNVDTLDTLCERCSACASLLLSHFVASSSRSVVCSVRQHLGALSTIEYVSKEGDETKEPRSVSELAFSIVKAAGEIKKNALEVMRGSEEGNKLNGSRVDAVGTSAGCVMRNGPTPGYTALHSRTMKGKKTAGISGLSMDIDRLFAKKVKVFAEPKFSCSSLLQAFFRVIFKALTEHVRELTLGRQGFQQIQLVARFLYDMVPLFVGDDTEALDALLNEFVNSAHARCLEESPAMDEQRIDNLVNQAKSMHKGGLI